MVVQFIILPVRYESQTLPIFANTEHGWLMTLPDSNPCLKVSVCDFYVDFLMLIRMSILSCYLSCTYSFVNVLVFPKTGSCFISQVSVDFMVLLTASSGVGLQVCTPLIWSQLYSEKMFKNSAHILSFLIIEFGEFFFSILGISHLVDIEFENLSLLFYSISFLYCGNLFREGCFFWFITHDQLIHLQITILYTT